MKQHGITIKNEAQWCPRRLRQGLPGPAAAPLESHRLQVWAFTR